MVRNGIGNSLRVNTTSVGIEASGGLHRACDGTTRHDLSLHVQRAVNKAKLGDLIVGVVGDGCAGSIRIASVALQSEADVSNIIRRRTNADCALGIYKARTWFSGLQVCILAW